MSGPSPTDAVLPRSFYARDPRVVAPELLGKVMVRTGPAGVPDRRGRIVEVEAYCGGEDPGSHAYRGETKRNRTMFGPPGRLYVYFTYGMHWCANAVCGDVGEGVAVLVRALAPLDGLDAMWASRPRARRERDLCSGPAKLCQALGLDGSFDDADLVTGARRAGAGGEGLGGADAGGVTIVDDGSRPLRRDEVVVDRRVGLTLGGEHEWRWLVAGDTNVSVPAGVTRPSRASGRARRPSGERRR